MRRTDIDIRRRIAGLMRLAGVLLLSAWTMLAVVSCGSGSGDDPGSSIPAPSPVTPTPTPGTTPVGGADTPIVFSAQQQEEQDVTRSVGLEQYVTMFTVYGYKNMSYDGGSGSYGDPQKVFPGYTVKWANNSGATSTSNSHAWEYVSQELFGQEEQTIKYWDWSARAYRFFAVAKEYDNLNVEEVGGTFKVTFRIDLTTTEDVPYYSHLWFSTGNPDDYPSRQFGSPVELEFLKPVSQVRIMFVYEDPVKFNRVNTPLTNISFHRSDYITIKQKGNVTITYPLTGTVKTETFSDTDASGIDGLSRDYREDEPSSPGINEEDHYSYSVLPIIGQGSFTLDVAVDGEPKSIVVPAAYMDWLPCYKYTYIFKIHVDGSVSIDAVQSAFTGWTILSNEFMVHNW